MGDRGLTKKLVLKLSLEAGCSEVLRNEEKPDYEEKPYQVPLGGRAAPRADGTQREASGEWDSIGCFGSISTVACRTWLSFPGYC